MDTIRPEGNLIMEHKTWNEVEGLAGVRLVTAQTGEKPQQTFSTVSHPTLTHASNMNT